MYNKTILYNVLFGYKKNILPIWVLDMHAYTISQVNTCTNTKPSHEMNIHYLISKCLWWIVNDNGPWKVSSKNGQILDVVPINTYTMLPK
jgi:hypothetical protein